MTALLLRRIPALLLLGLLAVFVPVSPAWACSCAGFDGPSAYDYATEFGGSLVVATIVDDDGLASRRVTLAVDTAVVGDAFTRMEVRTARDGAACGLETSVGDRVGLVLRHDARGWETGLCDTLDAGAVLALDERVEVRSGSSPPPPTTYAAWALGLLVALGVARLAWWRRHRRAGDNAQS